MELNLAGLPRVNEAIDSKCAKTKYPWKLIKRLDNI